MGIMIGNKLCLHCNEEFSRPKYSKKIFLLQKFCSRKCYILHPMTDEHKKKISENNGWRGTHGYWYGKWIGANHPQWKGGLETRKERVKESGRNWVNKNRDYKNLLNLRRVALKKNAIGSYTHEEWIKLKQQYSFTCPACNRKEPEILLSQDHIVPLSKGGTNFIENMQPLCRSCNSKKSVKIIKYERSVVYV